MSKIDYRRKGTLILASLLEDLVDGGPLSLQESLRSGHEVQPHDVFVRKGRGLLSKHGRRSPHLDLKSLAVQLKYPNGKVTQRFRTRGLLAM